MALKTQSSTSVNAVETRNEIVNLTFENDGTRLLGAHPKINMMGVLLDTIENGEIKQVKVWVSQRMVRETKTGKVSVGLISYSFYELMDFPHLGYKGFNLIRDYFEIQKQNKKVAQEPSQVSNTPAHPQQPQPQPDIDPNIKITK